MAKVAAKAANILISVALEDDIDSFSLNITQETPVVTSFADAGPRRVVGNYDYGLDVSGTPDFTAAQSDATLFGLIGSSGVAMGVDPTGVAVDANNPHYDAASVVLSSYSINAAVGGACKFSASLQGNSALARTVA